MGKFALKSPHVGARFVGLCPIGWDAVVVYAAEGLCGGLGFDPEKRKQSPWEWFLSVGNRTPKCMKGIE